MGSDRERRNDTNNLCNREDVLSVWERTQNGKLIQEDKRACRPRVGKEPRYP